MTLARLAQINGKLGELTRMQSVLADLLQQCLTTGEGKACPNIEMLAVEGIQPRT